VPRFVVASGSLPAGVPEDFYGHLARAAQAAGSKAVVDAPGWLLKPAIEAGLYLIKPNLREFQTLAGIESADPTELIAAARALIDRYPVELIALSMGCDGALLVGRDLAWRAEGLPIAPASVSGAGDSFLGAMLWSLIRHDSLPTALRFGVAAGSAALLHPGTELCLRADVERLAAQVVVTTVVGC
jgi:6-phosphofructokinase 2